MFRFAQPHYLYLLLIVPLLWGIFLYSSYLRKRNIKRYGNIAVLQGLMPDVSRYKPSIKFGFQLAAITLLIFVIAGPQFGSKLETVKKQGVEVMVALDVSNSMLAKDITPNRLEKSKQMLSRLVEELSNDKVGLIVFAGDAYTQLPITSDHLAAKMFLSSITPGLVPTQGTAIGSAIRLALRSFSPDESADKTIIILTDGENHEDDATAMAKEAAAKGIKVHVVGVGSPQGVPIPMSEKDNTFRKDKEGNVVISKLNELMAQEIAQAGEGTYVRADNTTTALRTLLREIEKMQTSEIESKVYSEYDEQFQGIALIVLLLLLIDILLLDRKNSLLKKVTFFS